jgi:uncharacterized YccA/Bax inhibitor family protein
MYPGIVMQAVLGTFAIFFVMAALLQVPSARSHPAVREVVIGALIAFVLVSGSTSWST